MYRATKLQLRVLIGIVVVIIGTIRTTTANAIAIIITLRNIICFIFGMIRSNTI